MERLFDLGIFPNRVLSACPSIVQTHDIGKSKARAVRMEWCKSWNLNYWMMSKVAEIVWELVFSRWRITSFIPIGGPVLLASTLVKSLLHWAPFAVFIVLKRCNIHLWISLYLTMVQRDTALPLWISVSSIYQLSINYVKNCHYIYSIPHPCVKRCQEFRNPHTKLFLKNAFWLHA